MQRQWVSRVGCREREMGGSKTILIAGCPPSVTCLFFFWSHLPLNTFWIPEVRANFNSPCSPSPWPRASHPVVPWQCGLNELIDCTVWVQVNPLPFVSARLGPRTGSGTWRILMLVSRWPLCSHQAPHKLKIFSEKVLGFDSLPIFTSSEITPRLSHLHGQFNLPSSPCASCSSLLEPD